jgi:ABC-2 type transport system permease protein
MNGIGTLLWMRLRRDRWQLFSWVVGIGLLMLLTVAAVGREYATDAEREAVLRLALTNPALLALRGAPQNPSSGAFLAFQILAFVALLAAFMNTFLAVRHSRADEESGRAELISATSAGRVSPTIATAIEGVIANILVTVVVALVLLGNGLELSGSIAFALGVGGTGLAFLGVGLLSSQVFSTSRGANGWAASLAGAAYLLRGIGDATGTQGANGLTTTSGWASWFSPLGWAQLMLPFAGDRTWLVLLDVALAVILFAVTLALQSVRDTGAGLVPARSGRATASGALGGQLGLAWRMQRSSIIGWGIGAVMIALFAGSLGPASIDAVKNNPAVTAVIASLVPGGTGAMLKVFVAAMMGIVGLIVAGCVLQVVMRLRQDEAAGTAELVMATRVGRIRWFSSYLIVGVVAAAVILLISGLVTGAMLAATGDPALFGETAVAAMVQLPAVLVYLAVLGLVFSLAPRATIPVGWALLTVGTFVGTFGGVMGLPEWVRSIAPSTHTPAIPLPNPDWSGAWWMLAVSVFAAALAVVAVRRRDLATG